MAERSYHRYRRNNFVDAMAHTLILGMTESGKTTCAKRLAALQKAKGLGVLVLDPMTDPEWYADYQTSDPHAFLRVVWASRACHVFIDEAGDTVGQYDTTMQRTATKGRHWGHSMYYLSQRGTQIARTVRDQCSHLILFTTALEDAKIHANEWNQPELKNAPTLQQGCYFHVTRFGTLQHGNLWSNRHDRTHSDVRRRDLNATRNGRSTTSVVAADSPSGTDGEGGPADGADGTDGAD